MKEKRKRKLVPVMLVIINALVIVGVVWIFLVFSRPAGTDVHVDDFAYTNHLPDADFNTSYVSVQGNITNLGPKDAFNVTLVVEVYVDFQGTLPDYSVIQGTQGHKNYLIEREYMLVGDVEMNSSKEFRFDVPYYANVSVPYYFDSIEQHLTWTT